MEAALSKSVTRFHEQLNNEQFGEIYAQADPRLRERVSEAAFTAHLESASDQMGMLSKEAKVLLTDRA